MTSKRTDKISPLGVVVALLGLGLLQGSSCLSTERPYAAPTAKDVLAAMAARGKQVRTMRAETRMAHRTPQGKVKATVRLMAQRGGRLRFDAVSPFDTPLATFVSDGSRFGLLDAQKNRHYYGPSSPCNIARLTGVMMQADEIFTVLGGSTPVIEHQSAELSWDSRANAEVVTLKGKTLTQTIRLDGTARNWDLLLSEIRDAKGDLVLQIKTGTFERKGGLRLPRQIWVRQPKLKAELDLDFKELEVNLTLPSVAFTLPAANGLPSQRVDCQTEVDR